jgi:hypothetical protein
MAVPPGLLEGRLILNIEDAPLCGLQGVLRSAGAEVITGDSARAVILVERPFLSAAILDCGPASIERRTIVTRLRERGLPFAFYGAEPPVSSTGDGTPFVSVATPADDIVRAIAFLIRRG